MSGITGRSRRAKNKLPICHPALGGESFRADHAEPNGTTEEINVTGRFRRIRPARVFLHRGRTAAFCRGTAGRDARAIPTRGLPARSGTRAGSRMKGWETRGTIKRSEKGKKRPREEGARLGRGTRRIRNSLEEKSEGGV